MECSPEKYQLVLHSSQPRMQEEEVEIHVIKEEEDSKEEIVCKDPAKIEDHRRQIIEGPSEVSTLDAASIPIS